MEKTIIEINGVKMEIDLRQAKRLDTFRVGDNVKVLVKEYSSYSSYPGVIVGFDEFKNLPTIVVCYLKNDYNGEVKFAYINAQTEGIEVCHMSDDAIISKSKALEVLDRDIAKKEAEVAELKMKKSYFIEKYDAYFSAKEAAV